MNDFHNSILIMKNRKGAFEKKSVVYLAQKVRDGIDNFIIRIVKQLHTFGTSNNPDVVRGDLGEDPLPHPYKIQFPYYHPNNSMVTISVPVDHMLRDCQMTEVYFALSPAVPLILVGLLLLIVAEIDNTDSPGEQDFSPPHPLPHR